MTFRCRIRFSPESIQWAVARTARYTQPQLGRQPVCALPLLERRQVAVELQLARQRLGRSEPCGSARYSIHFSPVSSGRVLFLNLANPSTEHFANFFELFRYDNILLVINRFYFPSDLQKEFYEVKLRRRSWEILQFLIWTEIGRCENVVNRFYQQTINFFAKRVSRVFR
jgi:hypothetical protein